MIFFSSLMFFIYVSFNQRCHSPATFYRGPYITSTHDEALSRRLLRGMILKWSWPLRFRQLTTSSRLFSLLLDALIFHGSLQSPHDVGHHGARKKTKPQGVDLVLFCDASIDSIAFRVFPRWPEVDLFEAVFQIAWVIG